MTTEERRHTAGAAHSVQALVAELTILRHGIGAVREVTTDWLPGMLGSLLRVTDLARTGAERVDSSLEHFAAQLARLLTAVEALDARVQEVVAQAESDALTGTLNRSTLERRLQQALEAAAHSGLPLSLMFCDIDHFKHFNDRYGHHTGDHVLRLVASALQAYPDPRALVGRYGGEELVLAMPGRSAGEALFIAEAIARALARRPLRMRGTGEVIGAVTISAGVAEWQEGEDAQALLRRADAAMYRAKRDGRNRVEAAA